MPARFGFFASFSIPLVAFLIALAAFVAGHPLYVMRPPEGSAVAALVGTLSRAASRTILGGGGLLLLACICLPLSFATLVTSFFVTGPAHDVLALSGLGLLFAGLALLIGCGTDGGAWVKRASVLALADEYGINPSVLNLDDDDGGATAHDVPDLGAMAHAAAADAAAVVRLLPVASCVVLFWMVYSQMSSNFQLQGWVDAATPLRLSHTISLDLSHLISLTRIRTRVCALRVPYVPHGTQASDGLAHARHGALARDPQRV